MTDSQQKPWTPRFRELPWLTNMCHVLLGELSVSSCDSTGKAHLESYAWFLLDFTHLLFPLAGFNLYFSTVINCNCEHNSFLSTVSPSWKSSTLGVVLRTPNTKPQSSPLTSYYKIFIPTLSGFTLNVLSVPVILS